MGFDPARVYEDDVEGGGKRLDQKLQQHRLEFKRKKGYFDNAGRRPVHHF